MISVIIDDEPEGIETLEYLLDKHSGEIKITGFANNIHSGFELIIKTKPDLVFLDVEMPGGNGFDELEKFSENNFSFEVIFTTAYGHYAIKAFEYAALDYLLTR